jgi:hypothetical protein
VIRFHGMLHADQKPEEKRCDHRRPVAKAALSARSLPPI